MCIAFSIGNIIFTILIFLFFLKKYLHFNVTQTPASAYASKHPDATEKKETFEVVENKKYPEVGKLDKKIEEEHMYVFF